jgi:NitT/TauT family transport system substrate-binding protein
MLYKIIDKIQNTSLALRIGFAALVWLLFISYMHYWLNGEHGDREIVKMGYMPVITNLASPLLDYATKDGEGVRFKAIKFSSFSEMAEALRNDQIQVAFMIAPLSIVLRQQGVDVKIIYIGNRHESTLVVRKDLDVKSFKDLAGKTLAVPLRYSGHNISALKLIEDLGLEGQINIVEMNPPDMASALTVGSLDAYYVGEPFAVQTVKNDNSRVLFYVEEVWPGFICNLVIVRGNFIKNQPEVVKMLVQGAARSGIWARKNPKEAARIASQYWNQPVELVEYALTTPKNRIVYDKFLPKKKELQYMADLMVNFGLIKENTIDGLIEDRFAQEADLSNITDFKSILNLKK